MKGAEEIIGALKMEEENKICRLDQNDYIVEDDGLGIFYRNEHDELFLSYDKDTFIGVDKIEYGFGDDDDYKMIAHMSWVFTADDLSSYDMVRAFADQVPLHPKLVENCFNSITEGNKKPRVSLNMVSIFGEYMTNKLIGLIEEIQADRTAIEDYTNSLNRKTLELKDKFLGQFFV